MFVITSLPLLDLALNDCHMADEDGAWGVVLVLLLFTLTVALLQWCVDSLGFTWLDVLLFFVVSTAVFIAIVAEDFLQQLQCTAPFDASNAFREAMNTPIMKTKCEK